MSAAWPRTVGGPELRRVDWRFLLPEPRVGSVAVLGDPDDALRSGLAVVGETVRFGGERRGLVDLVVVVQPSLSALKEAAAITRPGGHVYVEVDRRRARDRASTAQACARALSRLGLEQVGCYWHWPTFEGCLEIVNLASRDSVALSLARRRASRSSRVKAALATALERAGKLGAAVPCTSVLSRRPEPHGAKPASPLGALGLGEPGAALDRLGVTPQSPWLLVTPRFGTSRSVVALLARPGARKPAAVGKLGRTPDDSAAIVREAANLAALSRGRSDAVDTAPQLVWSGEVGGLPALVMTAIVGPPVNPRFVRRRARDVVEAGLEWLLGLPRSPARPAGERVERLIEAPLRRLAAAIPSSEIVERTLAVLEPLRATELPLVFEHGDVSHPNLVWLPGSRLGVIDWELAEPDGFPVCDLVFLLSYVASASARAGTPARHCEAFWHAFNDNGWALDPLRHYLRTTGVPSGLAPLLAVASFARSTAGMLDRAREGGGRGGEAEPGRWVVESRAYALWQASLDWAEGVSGLPVGA